MAAAAGALGIAAAQPARAHWVQAPCDFVTAGGYVLKDNGEPGKDDTFGITIDNWYTSGERFYRVPSRELAGGEGGGGNVQLHKGNRSNSIDPGYFSLQEWQMCGDMAHP